jgi:hypothetical protein
MVFGNVHSTCSDGCVSKHKSLAGVSDDACTPLLPPPPPLSRLSLFLSFSLSLSLSLSLFLSLSLSLSLSFSLCLSLHIYITQTYRDEKIRIFAHTSTSHSESDALWCMCGGLVDEKGAFRCAFMRESACARKCGLTNLLTELVHFLLLIIYTFLTLLDPLLSPSPSRSPPVLLPVALQPLLLLHPLLICRTSFPDLSLTPILALSLLSRNPQPKNCTSNGHAALG